MTSMVLPEKEPENENKQITETEKKEVNEEKKI